MFLVLKVGAGANPLESIVRLKYFCANLVAYGVLYIFQMTNIFWGVLLAPQRHSRDLWPLRNKKKHPKGIPSIEDDIWQKYVEGFEWIICE